MEDRSSAIKLHPKRRLAKVKRAGAEDRSCDTGDVKRLNALLIYVLPDDLQVVSRVIERVLEIEKHEGASAALAAVERAIRALS